MTSSLKSGFLKVFYFYEKPNKKLKFGLFWIFKVFFVKKPLKPSFLQLWVNDLSEILGPLPRMFRPATYYEARTIGHYDYSYTQTTQNIYDREVKRERAQRQKVHQTEQRIYDERSILHNRCAATDSRISGTACSFHTQTAIQWRLSPIHTPASSHDREWHFGFFS